MAEKRTTVTLREAGEFGQVQIADEVVAIIAGLVTKEEGAVICDKMTNKELHSCSLSMKCIKFDAMLSIDEKYRENIIAEIRETYKYMLDQGATSVWEVIEGDYAFGNAGSLCHGWSSVPVLYL